MESTCCKSPTELLTITLEAKENFTKPHPIYICTRCKQIIEEEEE